MTKLMRYHTVDCNPEYYWENAVVAQKLHANELKTFDEYKDACKEAGCVSYNESVFCAHLGIPCP